MIVTFLFFRHPYESLKKHDTAQHGIEKGDASNSHTSGMSYAGIFLKYKWLLEIILSVVVENYQCNFSKCIIFKTSLQY